MITAICSWLLFPKAWQGQALIPPPLTSTSHQILDVRSHYKNIQSKCTLWLRNRMCSVHTVIWPSIVLLWYLLLLLCQTQVPQNQLDVQNPVFPGILQIVALFGIL